MNNVHAGRLAAVTALLLTLVLASSCLWPLVAVGIAVGLGPPPLRAEVVVRGPVVAPEMIWVPGFWDWSPRGWLWVQGSWMRPPHARALWVAPVYHQRHGQWYYVRGHWR